MPFASLIYRKSFDKIMSKLGDILKSLHKNHQSKILSSRISREYFEEEENSGYPSDANDASRGMDSHLPRLSTNQKTRN